MRTKIYLAKSNRANPDHVSRVRSILSKYPSDIELVEFKGGSYSHKDLKECDVLIVVPDLTGDCGDNYVAIGKGLHEQIAVFKRQAQNDCDALVIREVDDDNIFVTQIEGLDLGDPDDYVNYSCMLFDEHLCEELDSILLNRFVSGEYDATQPKSKDSEYMYLLISRS